MTTSFFFSQFTSSELILIILIFIFLLSVITLFIYAIYLKIRYNAKERYRQKKISIWEETLLHQLYSDDISHLFSMESETREIVFNVKQRDFMIFGEFIENYLVDLRGEEYDKIVTFLKVIGFDDILMKALRKRSKLQRAYAAHFLGLMKYKKAESKLLELINDPSPVVYLNAFEALNKIGSEKNLLEIIKNVIADERIGQTKVIEIILSYGGVVDSVLMSLLNDKNLSDKSRRLIVDILSQRSVFESVPLILNLARSTTDIELKIGCIKAMGIFEDPQCLGFLMENLTDDNWIVRSQAVKAIGLIGDEKAVQSIKYLIHSDENYWVIYYGAQALKRIRHSGRAILTEIMENPPHPLAGEVSRYVMQEES